MKKLENVSKRRLSGTKSPDFFLPSPFFFFSFKNHALARIIVGRGQAKENAI